MFRCAITGKLSKPGEKMNKVVVETREKTYTDPETGEVVGKGWEIVKEVSVSDEGLKIWKERNSQT